MEEYLKRTLEHLLGRLQGPLTIRLILQPTAAAILAIRAAIRDARKGRPAYGWAVLTDPVRRPELLREGWQEVARVFLAAVIVDLIYEIIVLHKIYPEQSLIVATFLALLPYPLLRGLVNRIVRLRIPKAPGSSDGSYRKEVR